MKTSKPIQKARLFFKKIAHRFPADLPTSGTAAMNDFCKEILITHGLPDMPSYRHAIASMIMHLGPQTHKAPKYYFARSVKKAMANQIAYETIQRLKEEEKAYHEKVNNDAKLQGTSEGLVSAPQG